MPNKYSDRNFWAVIYIFRPFKSTHIKILKKPWVEHIDVFPCFVLLKLNKLLATMIQANFKIDIQELVPPKKMTHSSMKRSDHSYTVNE